jgi:6-phosphogluconolactonase
MYEKMLRKFFQSDPESKNFPSFDLILLGMGADGHAASLVPGSSILDEKKRWVLATDVPDYIVVKHRITLTLPVLNNAKNVLFLVSGSDKMEMLRKVMSDMERKKYPAGLIQPRGNLYWYTDIPEKAIM